MKNFGKIIILDSATTSDNHDVWQPLRRFGEVIIYDNTDPDQVAERIRDAEAVLTNKAPVNAADIMSAGKLRYIGVLATGYNIIDIEAAARKGVTVCNVPSYSTDSVAQQTFALLLELTNRVGEHAASVEKGQWETNPNFTYRLYAISELAGKQLGIIGFGNIGRKVAEIARAFGMKVATDSAREIPAYVERLSQEQLLASSDVVSLHTALTPDKYHMINADTLRLMKPSALIINTARGALIDDKALAEALRERRIAGAGLDVLEQEPPRDGSPLIGAPNCFVTPHVAWQSSEAITRLLQISEKNLECFIEGCPRNVVTP